MLLEKKILDLSPAHLPYTVKIPWDCPSNRNVTTLVVVCSELGAAACITLLLYYLHFSHSKSLQFQLHQLRVIRNLIVSTTRFFISDNFCGSFGGWKSINVTASGCSA